MKREPDVDRRSLFFWLPVSIFTGLLILWISAGAEFAGAPAMQAGGFAPTTGVMALIFVLMWAAFAYAASITFPHGAVQKRLLWAALLLPVGVMLLLRAEWLAVALVLAVAWLAVAVMLAWRYAPREPLATLMMIPMGVAAFTSILLCFTLLVIP